MRILLVEDDQKIASFIIKGLKAEGFAVDHEGNGEEGLHLALTEPYDAAIIDIMLPQMDGLKLIENMRREKLKTPVIILSAKGEVDDRVKGLQIGADDYLAKPFAFSELLARLQALIRRSSDVSEPTKLTVANISMNLITREVVRAGKKIDLQPLEFSLLEYLMRNAGRVVSKTMIMEHVWDYYFDPQTNVVESRIYKLREKIDNILCAEWAMFLKKINSIRHTLAFRLTLWYAGIFMLTSCVAFLFFYFLITSVLRNRTDQDLLGEARTLSSILKVEGIDAVQRQVIIEAQAAGEKKIFFRLLSFTGQEFSSSNMLYWRDIGIGKAAINQLIREKRPVFEQPVCRIASITSGFFIRLSAAALSCSWANPWKIIPALLKSFVKYLLLPWPPYLFLPPLWDGLWHEGPLPVLKRSPKRPGKYRKAALKSGCR
jgi:two-component system OmpR family response regulator